MRRFTSTDRKPTGRVSEQTCTLDVDGMKRSFLLLAPKVLTENPPRPLVFMFHGGGNRARSAVKLTGFSKLALRENFILVYPEGIDEHWADGRGTTPTEIAGVDDVLFTEKIIQSLEKHFPIDANRIFAAGMSNGAIFVHRLGLELASRIAAIAPVSGSLAQQIMLPGALAIPVSVIQFHGTQDAIAPYDGGEMPTRLGGQLISFEETARLWAQLNGCAPHPQIETTPGIQPPDGTSLYIKTWTHPEKHVEVKSISITGGGHTWPGGPQYLPVEKIGRVSREINATEQIWTFFQNHARA